MSSVLQSKSQSIVQSGVQSPALQRAIFSESDMKYPLSLCRYEGLSWEV